MESFFITGVYQISFINDYIYEKFYSVVHIEMDQDCSSFILKFHHPSSLIVSGPSQSGKTELVKEIIKKQAYNFTMKKVIWCYSIWQPWFLQERNIEFKQGLPDENENADLIVIDDQMNSITNAVADMFTAGSHHKNFSIILITQNLFPRIRQFRDISLNAHYLILFRNNRDLSQASCFARQAFPGKGKYFLDAYKKATAEPYSYLLVDVHPSLRNSLSKKKLIFNFSRNIIFIFFSLQKKDFIFLNLVIKTFVHSEKYSQLHEP